jgi:pimeloyl-ACP methyl ester carboxylesterase
MTSSETTTEKVRSADGTTIAFERSGDGPPLVIVDAALGFRRHSPLDGLAALLVADFTVYRYDRRGRGESGDAPAYAVEREVEDLDAVIGAAGGSAFVHGLSSGALLAMQAAAAGLDIPRLSLFEPPIRTDDDEPATSDFTVEMSGLVVDGHRREAIERFLTSVGLPTEAVDQMVEATPALETIAHTIVYDCVISDATTVEVAASIPVPTLVVDSEGSSENLTGWAKAVMDALPAGSHRSLAGEWHRVPDEDLAPVVTGFLLA